MSFLKKTSLQFLLLAGCLVLAGSLFLTRCVTNRPALISENNFDSLQLANFIEPDFPYISTSMDARKLGPSFPDNNLSARTLALQLGDSSYACFDTDMMRWTVAWTGEFLPMFLMPQISYKEYFNKNNKNPIIGGDPQHATGLYQGWSTGKPVFEDIREGAGDPEHHVWGPLPATTARWIGAFVYQNKAILNYSVGNTPVYEMPGSMRFPGGTVFTRTFRLEAPAEDLFLTLAEVRNATGHQIDGSVAYVFHGPAKDTVTAIGVLEPVTSRPIPRVYDTRYLTVQFPASETSASEATVAIWKGPADQLDAFKQLLKNKKLPLPDFHNGGPNLWEEPVFTRGQLSPDTAAFVTDILTLPLPNPWKRNVRAADIAFWQDGRAAVVTFSGDVWIVENIDQKLGNLKWHRFASGIHEPMSVEIRNNDVYVFGKEGIVRLVDLNHDGMADFYENFSNVMPQSPESREWAADLILGPDDCFYIAKGGALSNGPGYSKPIAKGFRAGSSLDGTILKVARDGSAIEVLATGLRGPYIGMHPKTGVLTSSDQQGNFVPSTPLYLIKKGDYYGVPPTAHRDDNPEIAAPLTWIPHNVDRSAISQAWITGNKMGPLSENLIHFSFGRPGLLRVLFDTTANAIQGGITVIPGHYPAPTSKGTVNPRDGQLYIAGFNLWGSSSNGVSALLRLRYTGKPSYMPNKFEAGTEGIVLQFDSEISKETAENPANFLVKRWNYLRTQEYGSGHYKLDGTAGQESLPVLGSYLSADRKAVFLLVPNMAEVMQMEVTYNLTAGDGAPVKDGFWLTVNDLSPLTLTSYGFREIAYGLLKDTEAIARAAAHGEEEISVKKGEEIFQKMACAGCHSAGTQTEGMYGPPFQGLYQKQREFVDGATAIADEAYLKESILAPTAKHVKGYSGEMPSYVGVLSDGEIESVVLYIKSLK